MQVYRNASLGNKRFVTMERNRQPVQWFSCLFGSVGLLSVSFGLPTQAAESVTSQLPEARRIASPLAEHLAQETSRPVLQLGSAGAAVTEVQALLTLMGYYSGPIDGFYREPTQSAVSQFQTAAGVMADGIVGPTTWQKLLPRPGDVAGAGTVAAAPAPEPTPAPTPAPAPPPTPAPTPTPAPAPTPTPAPTPAPASTPTPTAVGLPVLREGMYGPAVTRLQERLKALGAYDGAIDGVFGPQTAAAVRQVQARHDLETDGVVGPRTWAILFR